MAKKSKLAAALKQALAPIPKIKHTGVNPNTLANKVTKKKPPVSAKPKLWIPFDPTEKILLIGEGDFSFAVALLQNNLAHSITATSLDSLDELHVKYPDTAYQNIAKIENHKSCHVWYSIDGTKLHSYKKKILQYDLVIFNFPHLGNSLADQARNIRQHQQLILGFFESAKQVAPKLLVTLWDGEPYESWTIKKLARSKGLNLVRSGPFLWDTFKGYNHMLTARTGSTSKLQSTRAARMYLFATDMTTTLKKDGNTKTAQAKKATKRKADIDSDSDDDGW